MKKFLIMALAALMLLSLAACGGKTQDGDGGEDGQDGGTDIEVQEPTGSQITDTEFGDARSHEQLKALEFAEGELVDNPYYKRVTDPDSGRPCYMVVRESDGEPAYLPFDKTVVYVTDQPDVAYYERVPLTYKLDGETVETDQYQITVSGMGIPAGDAAATEAPAEGDSIGGETDVGAAVPPEAWRDVSQEP